MIGVLALQGAFEAHQRHIAAFGLPQRQVRTIEDLAGVDALVIPGGESTTMSKAAVATGMDAALRERIAAGMPVFGTCAGLIMLASQIRDGRPDQICLGALDIVVLRNGYGRQVDSFETEIEIPAVAAPSHPSPGTFRGIFIRAPKIIEHGPAVEVLATHDGVPVLVRQGSIMAAAFHPELTEDRRVHALFAALVAESSVSAIPLTASSTPAPSSSQGVH